MSVADFQRRVCGGERLVSTMLCTTTRPFSCKALLELPFDFLTIDMEHAPFSDAETADLIAVCNAAQMPTVVRIPRPEWHYVTRAFDSGASGVLAPYCETVEEAREVLRAAKLKPLKGEAAERAITSGEFPSQATREYLETASAGRVVIIGVESVAALANLDAILDLPGIDAVFLGPADLSISMGIPRDFGHPDFERAVTELIDRCSACGVPVCANFASLKHSVEWAKRGIRLIIHSADVRVLNDAYRSALAEIGAAAGRAFEPPRPAQNV